MTVKYFAYLRNYTKIGTEQLSGVSDVLSLIHCICKKYNGIEEKLLNEQDTLHEDIIVLVNGRNICFLQNCETKLSEGDEVCLFPRVAGG